MSYRHGTQYGYRIKACRCEACREWYNAMERAYRKRRMARTGERMLRGKYVERGS